MARAPMAQLRLVEGDEYGESREVPVSEVRSEPYGVVWRPRVNLWSTGSFRGIESRSSRSTVWSQYRWWHTARRCPRVRCALNVPSF